LLVVLQAIAGSSRVVVDVGANIASSLATEAAAPNATVHAIETDARGGEKCEGLDI
jgi:hypothetical protein